MGAGEYVSVRAQREMYEHQIGLERAELDEYPDEEAEELALIYTARGMNREDAHALAKRTIADPRLALDTLAREELGLNPENLGSPWERHCLPFFPSVPARSCRSRRFCSRAGTALSSRRSR